MLYLLVFLHFSDEEVQPHEWYDDFIKYELEDLSEYSPLMVDYLPMFTLIVV
jgi:hypothetical protein